MRSGLGPRSAARPRCRSSGAVLTSAKTTGASIAPETWTVLLIAVSTAVRLALAALVPPLGDEAYHWHLGSQFHLSYDHPPLTYWLAAIGPRLAPSASFLFARLPFVLLFGGSTWLVFLLGRLVGGAWAGVHAALLFSAAPYFLVGAGTAALPEGPLTFTWLLCLWLLARLFLDPQPERPTLRWLALGLALGAAFLSKYHALFIPLGLALFLLMEPAARRRTGGVGTLIALGSAAIVSLPVIVWNYEHGWMSFTLYLHRGVAVRGLHPEDALKNLAGQALLLMPWTWTLLVGCLVRGLTRSQRPPPSRLLSALAVGPPILFAALSASNGEWDQFHWPLVGYASLFPLAGAAQAAAVGRAAVWARRLAALSVASIVAVPGGMILYAATSWGPRISGLIPVEAPHPWVARNYDFSACAGLDDAFDRRGLLDRSNLFVCAGNYMDCGRLAWVLRGRLPVVCAGPWSVAKSYVFLPQASGRSGADALLVSRTTDAVPDLAFTRPFFSRGTPLGSVTVGRGAHQTILNLHLLEGMSRPLPSYSAPVAGWPACSAHEAPARAIGGERTGLQERKVRLLPRPACDRAATAVFASIGGDRHLLPAFATAEAMGYGWPLMRAELF